MSDGMKFILRVITFALIVVAVVPFFAWAVNNYFMWVLMQLD